MLASQFILNRALTTHRTWPASHWLSPLDAFLISYNALLTILFCLFFFLSMCGCVLAVKKQFTYLSCTQPRSSHRTQPNKSQQGENKEEAMGRCRAGAAGHSRCLWGTGGCSQSCQSHPCPAEAPGGYVPQQGQLPQPWLSMANSFSPKEGEMSISSSF